MTEITEMAEFVAAQLDREYGDARRISQGGFRPQRWEAAQCSAQWPFDSYMAEIYAIDIMIGVEDETPGRRPMALTTYGRNEDQHIARYDPERICLEIEAKRRILARHARCANGEGCCSGRTVGRDWCDDMADLAAPYAEHPRFKPEWKIDD